MTNHHFVGVDPATKTGFAHAHGSGVWNLTPATAAPSKGREAEPKYSRAGKLWLHLTDLKEEIVARHKKEGRKDPVSIVIVCEEAAGFSRGKAAVAVGHEVRGAVQAWCWVNGAVYTALSPADLKKFATGKGNSDKLEMIAAAKKYKPDVTSDDEADALHLYHWGETQYKL